jgi:hypothetical protein
MPRLQPPKKVVSGVEERGFSPALREYARRALALEAALNRESSGHDFSRADKGERCVGFSRWRKNPQALESSQ